MRLRAAALALGVLGAVVVLWLGGHSPAQALLEGFLRPLTTRDGVFNSLAQATPLILTALTWAIGVQAGVFNVGAEGAVLVSAGAAVAAGSLIQAPPVIHHTTVVGAAGLAGMLWSLPAAWLKLRRGVHEVVSTIMLNWVSTFLLSFLVVWPLRDPAVPMRSLKILPSARLESLAFGTSLTVAILLALACAAAYDFFLWHSKTGQHVRATGLNPDAARNCGVDVGRSTLLAFALGGLSSGLAGYALTAGMPPVWSISEKLGTVVGYGFNGIVVAAIGANQPLGCVLAGVVFGAILAGRGRLQVLLGIPPEITDVIAGLVILALSVPSVLLWMAGRRRRRGSR